MDSIKFKEISNRGRVAYGICCLEKALEYYGFKHAGWQFLMNELWQFCNQNMAVWEERMLELTPDVVCEEVAFDVKGYYHFSQEIHDSFALLYKESNEVVNRIVELIYGIGRTNLYLEITEKTAELKLSTLGRLQEIIDLMENNNIPLPPIEPFEKFPITENHGWGRGFTKQDLNGI